MVPDLRSWFDAPLRALRTHRILALVVGISVGVGALIAAAYYTEPTLFQYVLLPLGVGGTVYYLAHYDLTDWDQEARVRGFLRLFAMILLANSVVPETEPLADGMVSIVTVFGVLLFVVLTAVVDVLSDPDERDGGDSRDASGRTAGDGTGTPDRD